MKLKSLIEAGDPERIATGFQFTEGPVWHPDGYLIFSDIPASRIYKWTPDGAVTIWREPSGFSNGLTLDRERHLIACEHGGRRVARVAADGTVVTLADIYGGKRLNSPNDVVVKSDGTIYFTDPPYGLTPPYGPSVQEREQPCNGLYRIMPDGVVELLIDDFDRPNGLAFSADESLLYVDDSPRRHVRAFDMRPDGTLSNSRVLADMDHPQPGSPDGMKIDAEGAAGQLRLGRRRPADALHHRAHLALPCAGNSAGPTGSVATGAIGRNAPGLVSWDYSRGIFFEVVRGGFAATT